MVPQGTTGCLKKRLSKKVLNITLPHCTTPLHSHFFLTVAVPNQTNCHYNYDNSMMRIDALLYYLPIN